MRTAMWTVSFTGALAAVGLAGAARAAPSVEIRGAAARVVIIAEARPDIVATLVRANPRLPIRITRLGDDVRVTGDVGGRVGACSSRGGRPSVGVWLRGRFDYDSLPQIVIRAPLDVRVSAGDAVFGSVGRAASVDFAGSGCGDWTVGNVAGRLRVSQSGSGDVRTGSAGAADLSVTGSGNLTTQAIGGGLNAVATGSGDITAASVAGPLQARVAGSGDVQVKSGRAGAMSASITGSGDVRFGGVAASLDASVAGSGDVTVAQVTGPVVKRVFGSGDVRVGR